MDVTDISPLATLGLDGDGDEMIAIGHVEARFGVLLDKDGARNWTTVGAVFEALKRALPPVERARRDLWPRFVDAIAHEAEVDPRRVRPETRLLAERNGWWPLIGVGALLGLSWWIYQSL
jgi:hypothetical protein